MALSDFLAHLARRRAMGQSLAVIGAELGVSRQAVHQWLSGATMPSATVLLLAERVWAERDGSRSTRRAKPAKGG